jgi:hypothetical protein
VSRRHPSSRARCQARFPAYLRRRPTPRAALTRACNPSRLACTAAASNPSRAVRRRKPSCPPPIRRREGRREHRKEVRDSSVIFVRVRVHRVAGSASPDRCRRASPLCALWGPRRRPWSSPSSSSVRARRPGVDPAANGAPQRLFPRRAAACRRAPPRLASPPLLACAGSEPSDEHRAAQIELTPGQYWSTQCLRSPPLDLDPMDQIHPYSLPARFYKENLELFQNCNPVLPP